MDLHLVLDHSAGKLTVQITSGLRDAIRSGRLVAGARLPATRGLASDLGVGRGVVVAAYEQLIAEGFLLANGAAGTRVATLAAPAVRGVESTPHRRALGLAAAATSGSLSIAGVEYDLRPGKPDVGLFPRDCWASTLRRVLRSLPDKELDYPDPRGVAALRTEIAGYLGRVRAAIGTPDNVVITAGVSHAMSLICRVLVEEDHRVLAVEDPMGAHQLPVLRATGIELAGVPVDDEGLDVDALAATGARAVLVTPAHQFPTGVTLSARRRAELIDWAGRVDGVILEDDYDAEFRYDRKPVGCLQGLDPGRVVLSGSISKTLSPGLRLGWVLAPDRFADRLSAARAVTDLGAPVLDQYVLAEMINVGAYDGHLARMRRHYRSRRDAFVSALRDRLPHVRVLGVSAGLHLYVELPEVSDETGVLDAARRMGVAIEGVGSMRVCGRGPAALVLGYATLPEHRSAAAIERLAAAIKHPNSTRLSDESIGTQE